MNDKTLAYHGTSVAQVKGMICATLNQARESTLSKKLYLADTWQWVPNEHIQNSHPSDIGT
jgi:hypothetical protein